MATDLPDADTTIPGLADACLRIFELFAPDPPEYASFLAFRNDDKEVGVQEALTDIKQEGVGFKEDLFHIQLQEQDEYWADEQMNRFRNWTSNLGVFAYGHASVDYRLRDYSMIRTLMLQLLHGLHANLLYCGFLFCAVVPDNSL